MANCKFCKMGNVALYSHMHGKKHEEKIKTANEIKNYFKKCNIGDKSTNSKTSTSVTEKDEVGIKEPENNHVDLTGLEAKEEDSKHMQTTITQGMINSDVLKSEIIWTFFAVTKGYSNNSANDLNETFGVIFPDSSIASNFQLGKDKLKYLTNWGLAPYIKECLEDDVSKAPFVVIGFNESLNETTQTCQMDLVVRYWDPEDEQVKVRYWDSKFLGHTTHQDLLSAFLESVQGIDLTLVIQVSMDGPSTNWLFYQKFVAHRLEELSIKQEMLNIGSCGLHIVHGTFKAGIEATGWKMKKTMSGSYHVLHDTPARCNDYVSVTQSIEYPFSFCATRWVEDVKVADRLLHI